MQDSHRFLVIKCKHFSLPFQDQNTIFPDPRDKADYIMYKS